MDLTNLIKSKAIELGFDKVGITSPKYSFQYLDYFDNWIEVGKNGTMQWLDNRIEERKDVTKYFPEVKSIICFAINYYNGDSDELNNNEFKISRYAWGNDYHIIMKEKLKELLHHIQNELEVETKGIICVDSSPVFEKQWAKQAGLGWQGKNTLLLNDEFGSWMFLGELLLDIELEYDKPYAKDLCGSCTACVDVCPVDALTDYQLNASKCISYFNVEYKDKFTEKQKDDLHGWIYGCDICQQVCPWNHKSQKLTKEESLLSQKEIKQNSFDDWINVDDESFRAIFKNSTIKRIKHNRFLRNVKAVKETAIVD